MKQSYDLSYTVDVKANISDFKKLVDGLQSRLNELKMPAPAGKELESYFLKMENEFKELERITNKTTLSMADTKAADKSWDRITALLDKVKISIKGLGLESDNTLSKLFPEGTIKQVEGMTQAVERYKKSLKGISETQESKDIQKQIDQKKQNRKELKQQIEEAEKPNAKDIREYQRYQKILKGNIDERKIGSNIDISKKDTSELKTYIEKLEELSDIRKKVTEANTRFKNTQSDSKERQEVQAELDILQKRRDDLIRDINDTYGHNFKGQGFSKDGDNLSSVLNQAKEIQSILKKFGSDKGKPLSDKISNYLESSDSLEQIQREISELETKLKELGDKNSTEALGTLKTELASLMGVNISDLPDELSELQEIIKKFKVDKIEEIRKSFKDLGIDLEGIDKAGEKVGKGLNLTSDSLGNLDRQAQDLARVKDQILDFFSVSNAIQLFKRTMREAFDTVKELDAVMTETAVVTDFTVSDMWDKLPQYAKEASALGTSIASLYEATTLYYQQGLGDTAAMDVGTETMKMARIANMDAADATKAMTAALRGFNMEIGKTNATRVNDVYSELAAITAADTNQIATAMTKTASIASSANMEFETTAAFLAQIIETTQEAPETAGTAMKTIIARFTEVKELFSEGMLSGTDEEGEVIEINKIDKALQSVGISLKSFLRGEKGIDDIFLELAAKWDSLDLATQRYIATTAAGSRQQSRFIAMMSDYNRTMELVNAASNSAGASQDQFDKTLDSLDAKLERLGNAWDQFAMGILESDLIKGGIDILTELLEVINSITGALGKFGGPMAKIGLIAGGLKLGGSLLSGVTRGVKDLYSGQSPEARESAQLQTSQGMFRNPFAYRPIEEGGFAYSLGAWIGKPLMGTSNRARDLKQEKIDKLKIQAKNLQAEGKRINIEGTEKLAKMTASTEGYWKNYDPVETQKYENQLAEEREEWTKTNQQARKQYQKAEKIEQRIQKEEEILQGYSDPQKIKKSHQVGQVVGTTLIGVGALASFGGSIARESGNEELAEGLENVGTGAMMAGTGVKLLNSVLQIANVGWAEFGSILVSSLPTIGLAAAAIGLLGLGIYEAYKLSPEGQLKTAEKELEVIKEESTQASEKYEDLKTGLKDIEGRGKNIEKLTKGTQEWNQAVLDNNKAVTDMVGKYEELSGFVKSEDGVLSIDYSKTIKGIDAQGKETFLTVQDVLQREQVQAIQAESAVNDAQIDVLEKQLNVSKQNLLSDVASFNEDETPLYAGRVYGEKETRFDYDEKEYVSTRKEETQLTDELAKQIAEGQIQSIEQAKDWVADQGSEIYLDEESFSNLRQYGYEQKATDIQTKELRRQQSENIKSLGEIYGTSSELAENLGNDFISAMREKTKSDLMKTEYATLTEQDYRRYAELKGYDDYTGLNWGGNKGKFTIDGEVIKIDNNVIKEALAAADADSQTALKLANISSKVSARQLETFSSLVSTEGQELSSQQLRQFATEGYLSSSEGVFKAVDLLANDMEKGNQLAQDMTGDTAMTFDKWAENLGVSTEELNETITKNLVSAADRITDQRKDLTSKMAEYSTGDGSYEAASAFLAGFEERFSDVGRTMLADVFTSLETSGNAEVVQSGWAKFMQQAFTMSEQEAQALSNTIGEINWSNPIDAADQLNDKIKHGSASSKEFAQHMQETNTSFLDMGSQIRYLVESSEEFSAMSESLDEIIEQNGELSASDIYNLADEYKSLEKIMDNTGVSAGALAEVLENIRIGDLGVHQVTDAVMAAMGQIDGLASMIAGLNKDFSNFDPGIDENFATQFIAQASETFKTNLEKGAIGNSQLDAYMDYLIGKEWDDGIKTGEARTAKLQSMSKFLEQNAENMQTAWTNMADLTKGKQVEGLLGQLYKGDDLDFDIAVNSSTGEIELSGYENLTFDQMAENMAEVFGFTERMAKALLTDYANYSDDIMLNEKKRESDEVAMAERAIGAAATVNDKKLIDQSEIDAIYQQTDVDITKQLADLGAVITNFYDKSGRLKETSDIWKNFTEATDLSIDSLKTKEGLFSMAALEDYLAESGLSEIVQEQIKQGALEGIGASIDEAGRATEEYEVQARMSDGTLKQIKVEVGETFEEAYNQEDIQIQNDALATALANAITQAQTGMNAITPTVDTEGIQTQLNGRTYTITVNGVLGDISGGDVDSGGGPTGNSPSVGQKPHIGPSYASGLSSAKRSHAALTGEVGPELIWRRSQNEFYLAGMNGPEMTTVNPADTVFTAEETKQILNQPDGPKMPGFAKGLKGPSYANPPITSSSYGDAKKSGGKDSSSDKKGKEWENPFDKLYNLVRKIDEELRERERIERRYEKLLEDLGVSANKIIDISREELLQLEKERKLQEKLVEGRREQIKLYQQEKSELTKYANVTQNERGEDVLRINWDLIDAVKDTEEGESIEEYVSQLEEWFDSLTEAEDALWEIEDAIQEIKERGEDEYFDLEDLIKDALERSYQDQIDKLEDINESINDTNAELLEGIQKTIDKQRQDRENEKTEEEIADKQRRLSYLQMDTSGANAVEILELQKEIEEAQENYTDTLIDQKISELQEQNDEAAKQREKQIDLLQSQLDHYLETGRIWDEVYQLMENGLDKDNGLVRGSRLEEILKNEENFSGLSVIGKQEWWVDMDRKVAEALAYLEVGRQIENLGVKNKQIEFYTEDGKKLTGKVDDKGNVTTADGKVYNNVYQGANGLYYAGENYETPKDPKVENAGSGSNNNKDKEKNGSSSNNKNTNSYLEYVATYNGVEYTGRTKQEALSKARDKKEQDRRDLEARWKAGEGNWSRDYLNAQRNALNARPIVETTRWKVYKTGGLADFTGPAWLDGTKSRPELVLNQRDTQNFIQLKDILSSIFAHGLGNSTSTENNGDITYDIDINVESIGSDYDIDKVASKVKSLITQDAKYRNNNAVNLKR